MAYRHGRPVKAGEKKWLARHLHGQEKKRTPEQKEGRPREERAKTRAARDGEPGEAVDARGPALASNIDRPRALAADCGRACCEATAPPRCGGLLQKRTPISRDFRRVAVLEELRLWTVLFPELLELLQHVKVLARIQPILAAAVDAKHWHVLLQGVNPPERRLSSRRCSWRPGTGTQSSRPWRLRCTKSTCAGDRNGSQNPKAPFGAVLVDGRDWGDRGERRKSLAGEPDVHGRLDAINRWRR